jgi:hypothetical protein
MTKLVQLSSVQEAVKTGPECVKLKGSPPLEAIARERLVKTQQASKDLVGAVYL